uniref:Uncharacterized protein n=1 Tax=Pundamilia nyererei TaxID=303518 RepID=A0A3B4EU56_9CICH
MKALLFKLLIICLLGIFIFVSLLPLSEDEQNLRKRYAESTIASEFSKIMDSMVQKNFIKFLLSQRQKKTKPADAGKDLEEHQYNNLLKLSLQEKQGRNI